MTTSIPLVQSQDNLESLSAAAPVRELVEPIPRALVSTTSAQAFGTKCFDSSTSADRNSSSGRTLLPPENPSQDNNTQSLEQFSGVLPRAGLMQNGKLFPQLHVERPTGVSESLLLPTPMAHSRASDKYRTPGQDRLEQSLRPHLPLGHVSHPALREWLQGFPNGWTDITEPDGGPHTFHPLQSVPLNEVSSTEYAEYRPLETVAHHNKLHCVGDGSLTWQDCCPQKMQVWSECTITHKVEFVEQKSDAPPALASDAAVIPAVVEELAGALTDHLLEAGSQTISQDVLHMVKSVDDASVTAVEVFEELTSDEAAERQRLELTVERAFYEAGAALLKLRSKRLYRSTHSTFEVYCRERFGFTRRHVDYLVLGSQVVENLLLRTNGSQILPTSERQVRPLTTLEPDEQREVWQQAVVVAGGKLPSGRIVKGIVERLKEKPLVKASDLCQVGQVFTLAGLVEKERKYNCCWAITIAVRDFTVEVDVHDATLTVKPENLQPIDDPQARRQLPQILKRIKRLRNNGLLDRGAYHVLEGLGQQTYLSEVEEKLLSCLEAHYGVSDAENQVTN